MSDSRTPLPTGIFRTPRGYRAFVWVPDPSRPKGRMIAKRFPETATIDEMRKWRETTRVAVPTGVGFVADAEAEESGGGRPRHQRRQETRSAAQPESATSLRAESGPRSLAEGEGHAMTDRPRHYILRGHDVEAVPDVFTWAAWFETADRTIAKTTIGEAKVSTVFLGLDYQFGPVGPPLVFETMVFGGVDDQDCERYATWDEAVAGHARIVARLQQREPIRREP